MTIEERLENMERELERQKRRNHWLLGAILLLVGGLVATGVFKTVFKTRILPVQAQIAGAVKEIRANGFSLEDEKGEPRAVLAVVNGDPRLMLLDENGQNRFAAGKTWTVSPDGKIIEYPESSLILYGPDGKVIWSAID